MGKVKGKHRLEKYYHLAKEQGYRSRAAWKLIQLDSKFNFLRSSQSVLDLCAAPGGWMQVAVKRVLGGSLVIGVDLDPIRPIRGAISVQQDITTPKCRSTMKKLMADNGCRAFDLVLHDGSPNVGGAWAKEATSQNSKKIHHPWKFTSHKVVATPSQRYTELLVSYKINYLYAFPYHILLTPKEQKT